MEGREKIDVLSSIIGNMTLCHEMIMDGDFKLTNISESPNNSLEKVVHGIVHQAFWDALDTDITSEPPKYENAYNVLMEMKSMLLEIIPKKCELLRKEVEEYLDGDLISQEISHGAFDVYKCANCVLSTMSKLCAPVRDQSIDMLKKEESISVLLRGAMELINLIKMDIVNYELNSIKPILIQNAVDYEKEKFQEYLKENPDGTRLTNYWLEESYNELKLLLKSDTSKNITPEMVIAHAFLSLLAPSQRKILPETLFLDEIRLKKAFFTFEKLTYVVSVLTYSLNFFSQHLSTDQAFVNHLKETIDILLREGKWDSETMESIFLQVIVEAEKEYTKKDIPITFKSDKSVLQSQLKDLLSPENSLKHLISSRLRDYVMSSLTSESVGRPTSSVLLPVENELKEATIPFCRVVSHNKKVHFTNYVALVHEIIKKQEMEASLNIRPSCNHNNGNESKKDGGE